MKTALALMLLVVGTLMMVGGFAWAVWEFAQLYNSALTDGMAEGPDSKKTSSAMLTAAAVGVVGFFPATAGSVLLGKGLIGRLSKRMAKR